MLDIIPQLNNKYISIKYLHEYLAKVLFKSQIHFLKRRTSNTIVVMV